MKFEPRFYAVYGKGGFLLYSWYASEAQRACDERYARLSGKKPLYRLNVRPK